MILLDENEYEKTLNELSEIPFGGKQQKSTITQHELHPKVFNEQPVEMEDRRLAFIHPKSTRGVLLELYELK